MGSVELIDVSKTFTLRVDGAEQTVRALDHLSFRVNDGEIVALIGPSGCGKTTALRIAMGLEGASGGKVTVDGVAMTGCGHDRGMVFQHAELLPWLTALENVMFGLEMKGVRGAELPDEVAPRAHRDAARPRRARAEDREAQLEQQKIVEGEPAAGRAERLVDAREMRVPQRLRERRQPAARADRLG